MESAPKDGTWILVYCSHGQYVVRWPQDDELSWSGGIQWWQVEDNRHGPFALRGDSPTHWMPLPPAPPAGDTGGQV